MIVITNIKEKKNTDELNTSSSLEVGKKTEHKLDRVLIKVWKINFKKTFLRSFQFK